MDLVRTLGYMAMWSIGYVAVHTLTANTMQKVQDFIGGQGA
jgi:hypothetical protein